MGICASKASLPVVQNNPSDRQGPVGSSLRLKQRPANFMQTGARANRVYLSGDDFGPTMRQSRAGQIPTSVSMDQLSDVSSASDFSFEDYASSDDTSTDKSTVVYG